jgi:hypothetical protein
MGLITKNIHFSSASFFSPLFNEQGDHLIPRRERIAT